MKTSLCLLFASLFLLPTPARAATDSAAALFNSTTLRTLHLTLTPDQYKALQPTIQRRQPGGGFMRRMEYPVVHAAVEFQGKTYNDVAVCYKGNSSFMMARNSLKKSLKLEFGKFVEGQSFFGLSTANLNNNAGDPSGSRETLGYELFAAAGVPACRTTLLRVELSVPGEFDHQLLGLYTLVEEVNKKFLKSHLGESKGLLLKPDMARDLPLQGDDWESYKRLYVPKTDGTPATQKRFIDFLKLIHEADDAAFDKQIESYLDVDEFLRFLAVNVITSNLDSILSMGHNFYIYVPADCGPIQFIPWDLNEAFGGFGMGMTGEMQTQLSLIHPHAGQHKLIERTLAIPRFKEHYKRIVADLTAGPFSVATMNARIDTLDKLTADIRAEEKKEGLAVGPPGRPRGFNGPGRTKPDLKPFVAARNQSITDQLAGKSAGQVPPNRRGPGGGPNWLRGGGPGIRPDDAPPRRVD